MSKFTQVWDSGIIAGGGSLDNARNLIIDGDYLYAVSNSAASLVIYDISDPLAPVQQSLTAMPNAAIDIRKKGQYLLISCAVGVMVYDVSNVLAPGLTTTVNLGNWVHGTFLLGNYLYCCMHLSNKFQIIEVTDPSSPSTKGSLTGTTYFHGAHDVWVDGIYAYVANYLTAAGEYGLTVVDVSDVNNPSVVIGVGLGATYTQSAVRKIGDYIYCGAHTPNSGLNVWDVSNPAAPVYVNRFFTIAGINFGYWMDGYSANIIASLWGGPTAHPPNYGNHICFINVSTPASPKMLISTLAGTTSRPGCIFVNGNYVYISWTHDGTFDWYLRSYEITGDPGMSQVIVNGYYGVLSTTNTEYQCIANGGGRSTTETAQQQLISTVGNISRLLVELTAAPGVGKSRTFTLRINGADTVLTLTISDLETSGSDLSHSVTVQPGDLVSLKSVPTSTPAATYNQSSLEFAGNNPNESLILGYTGALNGSTLYSPLGCGGGTNSATESHAYQVIPTTGKLTNLFIMASAACTLVVTLRKNGVSQSLTCSTAGGTVGVDNLHQVSVSPGDVVDVVLTTNVSVSVRFGCTFMANVNGESLILGGSKSNLNTGATAFNQLATTVGVVTGNESDWGTTEAARQQLAQVCTFKNLYIKLSGSPGAGKSYTFTVRANVGNTALTVPISDLNTTGNDVAHLVSIADGDNVDLQSVPSGTPSAVNAWWGLVAYLAPIISAGAASSLARKLLAAGII